MRSPTIEFHGDPERAVLVIQVAGAPAKPAHRLPSGAWESVRTFDAPDIPQLQH
jgi:hypothetical protein